MTIKEVLQRHIIFKSAVLIVMLLCTMLSLHIALAPYIRILLIWGGAEIVLDFFTGRRCWKQKDIFLLLAFLAVYLVSVIIGDRAYLPENLKAICYMGVVFIAMYGGAFHEDERLLKKEINIIARVMQLSLFIVTAICFYSFLIGASYRYTPRDYVGVGYFGMTGERLAGLFSPNTGGAIYVLLLLVSAAFIYAGKTKLFSTVCITLSYICLALSGSRTALFALAATFFIAAVFLINRGRGLAIRLLMGFAAAAITVMAAYPVQKFLPRLQEQLSSEAAAASLNYEDLRENEAPEEFEVMYSGEIDQLLSGRITLWKSGLKAYAKSPVIGITNEAILDKVTEELPDESFNWTLQGGGLHSVYLTVLVAAGIPGVLTLAAFAVYKLHRLKKLHLRKEEKNAALAGTFSVLAFALISEFMETRIVFTMNFFFVVFWLTLGYASALARLREKE